MAAIRAFIAVDLPEELRQPLRTLSKELHESFHGLPLRWVAVEKIHLTLKFLGDVSIGQVDAIGAVLEAECRKIEPFRVSLVSLGLFPHARRPRVLWVGVEAEDPLYRLQQRLEHELERLGYPAEGRPFSPHLTLARVQRGIRAADAARIGYLVHAMETGWLAAAMIEELCLFKSELKPGGAVYTKLVSARLSH